jgi:hypothetical protein
MKGTILMSKRILTLLLLFLSLLAFSAAPVLAAEGIEVTLTPDRQELAVGDPVQLTLEVTHPAGYQVILPKLEQAWGPFEVRSQSQATTTANDDGSEATRQTIEVTLFDLGEFETPELQVGISDGAGQVSEERVPPISLTVVSTLAEDDNNLRDIKPQAALTVPPLWPWIVGGVLLAALAAMAGWWAYRRRQGKPFGLAPAVDNRPAWQVAFDTLAAIEGMDLLAQGRFKEHYTLVTDTLRTYLENQFGLRVFDRTTSELKPILRGSELQPEHSRRLLDLFADSDLVKFAKFVPDLKTASRLTARARELVELTRPKPELEAVSAEAEQPPAPKATSQLSYESGQ